MSTHSFEYRAFDATGKVTNGVASAESRQEAFRQLQALGFTPVSLRAASGGKSRRTKIASKDLAHFTYQLSVLLNAKIPLADGLLSIADQEREGALRGVIQDVAKRVTAGEGVSAALQAHRATFGEVFVESVRAAERSGNLGVVLDHLAEMLERSQETTRQVRSALLYPLAVAGVLGLASVFLVGVIVPKFGEMFAKRGASLPLLTQVMMAVGVSVRGYWWAYGAGVVAAVASLRWMARRPAGLHWLDRAAHRVPLVRDILRGLGLARFSRVLGISLSSGLGLIEGLTLAGKASGRAALMQDVEVMVASIRTGSRLGDCLRTCSYFPQFAKRMLTAGEQSGDIPRMCGIVSRHFERECEHLTKDLSGAIEPVMIVMMAGVVLLVALSIFLPMWDMAKLAG